MSYIVCIFFKNKENCFETDPHGVLLEFVSRILLSTIEDGELVINNLDLFDQALRSVLRRDNSPGFGTEYGPGIVSYFDEEVLEGVDVPEFEVGKFMVAEFEGPSEFSPVVYSREEFIDWMAFITASLANSVPKARARIESIQDERLSRRSPSGSLAKKLNGEIPWVRGFVGEASAVKEWQEAHRPGFADTYF